MAILQVERLPSSDGQHYLYGFPELAYPDNDIAKSIRKFRYKPPPDKLLQIKSEIGSLLLKYKRRQEFVVDSTRLPNTQNSPVGQQDGQTVGQQPKLFLLGPIRLINSVGEDCCPKGGLRNALLALLALSNSQSRGRVKLQDILWEDISPERGAANLRTALSVLRRELRTGLGFDPITADSQTITIDLSGIWVDVLDKEFLDQLSGESDNPPDLLEGLNLRGCGGEEFEDWLRSIRQQYFEKLQLPGNTKSTVVAPSTIQLVEAEDSALDFQQQVLSTGVGLLPVIVVAGTALEEHFGNAILDAIAQDLTALASIEIYDYRDKESNPFEPNDGVGPEILLRLNISTSGDQIAIQVHTLLAQSKKLIAGNSVICSVADGISPGNVVISGFIAQNVDRLLDWIEKSNQRNELVPDTPYHVLNRMFQLDDDSIEFAYHTLLNRTATTNDPIYRGLLAYLYTFKVGENWGNYSAEVVEQSKVLVAETLSRNPVDGLALCMTGHVLGYTLHDYASSGDLLRRAVDANPSMAICWDHLALHYLYTAQFDKAMQASRKAIRLGAYSPLRSTYETTLCMIATLSGDFKTAVYFGKRALSKSPNFCAALRYMSVSFAHIGEIEQSLAIAEKLKNLDSEFSPDWVDSGRWTLPDSNSKDIIARGLDLAGLK